MGQKVLIWSLTIGQSLIKENTGLLVIDCTVTSGTQSVISLAAMMSPLVDLAIGLKTVQPIGKMHTPSLH